MTLFLMTAQSQGCFIGDITASQLLRGDKDALAIVLTRLYKIFPSGPVTSRSKPTSSAPKIKATGSVPSRRKSKPGPSSVHDRILALGADDSRAARPTASSNKPKGGKQILLEWCQTHAASKVSVHTAAAACSHHSGCSSDRFQRVFRRWACALCHLLELLPKTFTLQRNCHSRSP